MSSTKIEDKNSYRSEIKVIVIGTSGAGKTSFVHKYTNNSFQENYKATVVSEYRGHPFNLDGHHYLIQVWDVAGQDNNTNVTKIFAKNALGAIVMSDSQNQASLERAMKWKKSVDSIQKFLDGTPLPCILVENKADLLPQDQLNEMGVLKKAANEHGFIEAFKSSAKTGYNVNESMEFLLREIIKRLEAYEKEGNNVFAKEKKGVQIDGEMIKAHKERKRDKGDTCC